MKKICSLFLAVILLFAALPLTAHAAEIVASGYCGGEGDGTNLTWSLDSDGLLTISGKGAMADYTYYNGSPWRKYADNLRSLAIEDSVTSIGDHAFRGCSSLTSVTIPDSVTSIGDGAFRGCSSLTSVTIPDSVTSIGEQAFWGCSSLTSVTIPDSVTSIDGWAFWDCSSLTSVTIGDSVTSIGNRAFYYCSSLTSVYFCGDAPTIGSSAFGNASSDLILYYPKGAAGWTSPTWHDYNTATWDGIIDVPHTEYNTNENDAGEKVNLYGSSLDGITGKTDAVTAVTTAINELTTEEKNSTTGIDKLMRYAEGAVYHVATRNVESTVEISESSIGALAEAASDTAAAVSEAFANESITLNRDLTKAVRLKSSENSVTINIKEDSLNTSADRVLVETDYFTLTVNLQNMSSLLENGAQTITVKTIGTGYGSETDNSVTTVELTVPGGSISEPVTLALEPAKGDATYQAIVTTDGTAVPCKYNAVSGRIEARIRTDGKYMIISNEKNFTDITNKSSEMQSAIKYLASKGIINGTSATTYNPDGSISRAEIAALILRALGKLDEKAANTFTDVPTSKWYYGAAGSSQKYGIINGFEDSTFRGENVITKEQITAVAARVLKNEMGYKVPDDTAKILSSYSDTISNWAKPEVALAALQNLVIARSDGKFLGSGGMTRGEAAVVISRLFSRIW